MIAAVYRPAAIKSDHHFGSSGEVELSEKRFLSALTGAPCQLAGIEVPYDRHVVKINVERAITAGFTEHHLNLVLGANLQVVQRQDDLRIACVGIIGPTNAAGSDLEIIIIGCIAVLRW